MKSSCVGHPANDSLVLIRKWQLEFCDSNPYAAALLSFLEYFPDIAEHYERNMTAADQFAD